MKHIRLLLILPGLFLASCIGTKMALHTSSSNFGLDIDSTPPSTDIGLGRSELSVQPAFADGQTPSSLMGFSSQAGQTWFTRFLFGTGSVFATGQAAANLAGATGSTSTKEMDDLLKVPMPQAGEMVQIPTAQGTVEQAGSVEPERPHLFKVIFGARRRLPFKEDEMFPLITGTKTNYGLHVEWDAATQAPRSVKAGFNRKEISFAPIIGTRATAADKNFKVKLPSVLAAHQMNTQGGVLGEEKGSVKFDYVQYLATGRAAEKMGEDAEVRKVLRKNLGQPIPAQPEGEASGEEAAGEEATGEEATGEEATGEEGTNDE